MSSRRRKKYLVPDFEARSVALIAACVLAPLTSASAGMLAGAGRSQQPLERRITVAPVQPPVLAWQHTTPG